MSNPPPNAWQTTNRSRPSNPATRTPQSRSSNASPAPASNPAQAPKQNLPINNVWSQKSSSTNSGVASGSSSAGTGGSGNGQPKGPSHMPPTDHDQTPVRGLNMTEVTAFLGRNLGETAYKIPDAPGAGRGGSGGPWGAKAGNSAGNQPFLIQLGKQIATLEGGG